jgi:integration host factor subunit alpha
MALTKATVAESIPSQLHFTKIQSIDCVETLLKIMKKTLVSGEDVLVSGFGKFRVNPKRERGGRNPATGGVIMLAARRVVTFKWSGKLRTTIKRL